MPGLIFYIRYVWRSSEENFDEFESYKINNIRYFDNNIPQFPISLYTKINQNDNDTIFNFTFANNSDGEQGTFKVNSYIVDGDGILNRKNNSTYLFTNKTYGDSFIRSENLTGEAFFSQDEISKLKTNETKYFLIEISSENSEYTGISLSIEKITNVIKSTGNKTELLVPKASKKYFSTSLKTKINILKLRKDSITDLSMFIKISLNVNSSISLIEYDENTTINDSNELEYNSSNVCEYNYRINFCKMENLSNTSIGVLIYIIVNSTDNNELRFLDEDNITNYVSIKYKSYSNETIPIDEKLSYEFDNQDLSVSYDNEDYLNVSFNKFPIDNGNVSYILNFYNNINNDTNAFYSIYAGEPKNNYSNYSINDNIIEFIIKYKDIDNGEYIINAIANIIKNDDIETFVYKPTQITISKKKNNDEEEFEGKEEENIETEINIEETDDENI